MSIDKEALAERGEFVPRSLVAKKTEDEPVENRYE